MSPRPAVAAVLTLLAGAATACGHSPATTLHGLLATPPAAALSYAGPPVRVDAVRLPAALDRLELLRPTGPGRYEVREFDRWAAPPSRLARQALTEDLALRLPPGAVAPPGATGAPVTAVTVEVLSFTPGPGTATLTAAWTRGCRPGEDARRAFVQLQTPASDDTPDAMGALLAQLADRIAADLAAAPDLACRSAVAPPR